MTSARRIFVVLTAAALAVAAASCGGDDDAASSTSAASAATTAAPASTASTTATTAASAAPAGGGATAIAAGSPEAAAADAYEVVFDSAAAFGDKAPHLEDAEALRPAIEAYAAAATSFGGIRLEPTAVTIASPAATVTYDVYFGTTRQYDGLEGSVEDRSGTWVVTRDEFCSFMSSARVTCPT